MRKNILFPAFVLLLQAFQTFCHLHELNIGVLIEQPSNESSGMMSHASVDLAVQKVNNDPSILNEYKLKYFIGNSGCNGQQSIGQFAKLVYENKVDAIIGPSCNEGCLSSGFLATYHNLFMMTHKCSTSKLNDKSKYPTFGRVRAFASSSVAATASALGNFFKSMKWSRLGVIHSNEEAWAAVTDALKPLLQNMNIKVIFDKDYIRNHVTSSASACMLAARASPARSKCR